MSNKAFCEMLFIDVHAHFDDRDYRFPDHPSLVMKKTDLEPLQISLKDANVALTVFFVGLASIREAPGTAGGLFEANQRLLEWCRPHRGKFAACLFIHPSRVSESVEVIERHHHDPMVVGVGEILPEGHLNGDRFDTGALREIAECAAKHGLPMTFHTGTSENVRQLEWLINQVPTGQYVLAHAAGEAVREGLALMDGSANVWMDLSVHAWKPGVKEPLLDRADRSRLLFGSDYPIESHRLVLEHLGQIGFASHEMEAIAHLNALRLYPKLRRSFFKNAPDV